MPVNPESRVTKRYLIRSLMKHQNLSKKEAVVAVDGVVEAIVEALRDGNSVSISNVGTMLPITRAPRDAWNPSTRSRFIAPEKTTVRWRPSPTLVGVLNGKIERERLAVKAPKS